jgi:hypothetical protein
MELYDNGPGSTDTIGITVLNKGGGLYYSNDWNGTQTVQQTLGGGNLQIILAQLLAGERAVGLPTPAPLTQEQLRPIVAEAMARWQAVGIDPQRLAALEHATFRIADLPGNDLGMETEGVITLDRTADGYGWYIDATPSDDSAFAPGAVNSPARGHIDLLSVVAHELGHLLGYGEDDSAGVTGEYLAPGVRHVPVAALPALGAVPRAPIKPASSPLPTPALAKPQGSATLPITGASDGLMVLDPAIIGQSASRTAATGPARAPLAASTVPVGSGRSRPIVVGPIGPSLDRGAVDSLFGSAMPGSLFDAEGSVLPARKAMRRAAT